MVTVREFANRCEKAQKTSSGFRACCPAHEDHHPSLDIDRGDDGRVLLTCRSRGCDFNDIVAAVGLEPKDLLPDRGDDWQHRKSNGRGPTSNRNGSSNGKADQKSPRTYKSVEKACEAARRSAEYEARKKTGDSSYCLGEPDLKSAYKTVDNATVGYVLRWNITVEGEPDKITRPVSLRDGQWAVAGMSGKRPCYNLPKIIKTTGRVFIFEGEKAADAALKLGLVATTSAGGSNAADKSDWSWAAGKDVVHCPDNDDAGEHYAETVAQRCHQAGAKSIKIMRLPGLPPGGDIADLNITTGEVLNLAKNAERWEPEPPEVVEDDEEPIDPGPPWPEPLADEAYHGVIGDLVRLVEPHTEADPAAILIQALVSAGSVIGRLPRYLVGDTAHYLNLYAVVVGESSKARKGTSADLVSGAFKRIDDDAVQRWIRDRRLSGLSSGEGLIFSVRDPIYKRSKKGEEELIDEGETDKRLLITEPEFGNVLRQIGREKNTLSSIIRQGWDSGQLRTMTKNSPLKATGAHLCMIGHITVGELKQLLSTIDASNGFANRHLWCCAKRQRLLPDPSVPAESEYRPVVQRLAEAIVTARTIENVTRADDARQIWHDVYPRLSRDRVGLAGACTSRAEAQVTRLAALYAILDGEDIIRAEHMRAGLAVWRYCEQSATYIFGDKTGDATADRIRGALRAAGEDGLSRSGIRDDLFRRNKSSAEIGRALSLLERMGLARSEKVETDGRYATRWISV